MIMSIAIILGGVLLAVFCFQDYRRNVVKPLQTGRYYIAFSLFILVNWMVYISLLAIVLNINLADIIITRLQPQFTNAQYVLPLFTAFTYFGVGAGSFKFGAVEFRFYNKLLGLFQNLFSLTGLPFKPLPQQCDDGKTRYKKLKEKFEQLQLEASASKGTDNLPETWKKVKTDTDNMVQHIDELSAISNQLSVWPITKKDLGNITRNINDKTDRMWQNANQSLFSFVIEYIFMNIKDRKRIEAELEAIGCVQRSETEHVDPKSRIIGVGLLTGLVFGLVSALQLAKGHSSIDPITRMWTGAFAFTVFALFYSEFRKITNIGKALLHGFTGGLLGHFTWLLCDKTQEVFHSEDLTLTLVGEVITSLPFRDLGVGALYGAVIAIVLFACRHCPALNCQNKYIKASFCGAAAFLGLHLLLKLSYTHELSIDGVVRALILGVIALLGLSYATNIFERHEGDPT